MAKAYDTKEENIRLCMEASGLSREEILKQMRKAYKVFGIGHKEFTKKKLYGKTEAGMARRLMHLDRKKAEKKSQYKRIKKASGLSKDKIKAEIKAIEKLTSISELTLKEYYRLGLFRLSSEKDKELIEEKIKLIGDLEERKRLFISELHRIDLGETSYDKAVADYDSIKTMIAGLLDEVAYVSAKNKLLPLLEEKETTNIDEYVADMFATEELLGFKHYEYMMFRLYRHDLIGKREFISDAEKTDLVKIGSTSEIKCLLDDKYESYKALEKYYGRKLLKLNRKNYISFVRFCIRHPVFVKKNSYDSLGRGVMKVDIHDYDSVRKVYEAITKDLGNVTVEELICPHRTIEALNPSSVNTVRVIVCRKDGAEPVIVDTFMKIGRDGSFVDNGGAGGILVHIDPQTGVFDSDGVDESGKRFENHPDHGYKFKGYQLDKWSAVIKLSKEAMKDIEGLAYVGWDFTMNRKGEWIIVEGNSGSQLIGPQGTTLVGIKRMVCDAIGYDIAEFTATKKSKT